MQLLPIKRTFAQKIVKAADGKQIDLLVNNKQQWVKQLPNYTSVSNE